MLLDQLLDFLVLAGKDAKSNRLTVFAWIDLNAIPHWNADKYATLTQTLVCTSASWRERRLTQS